MRRLSPILVLLLPLTLVLIAQTAPKKPPSPAEYGQWETLVTPQRYGGLSPDGKWLAYGINRSNGNNEVRITNIADGTVKTTAFGTQPAFSSDSKWAAFSIGYSEAQQDKMRKDKKPVQNKLGILNLASGQQTVVDAIVSFTFSPDGKWLAMRKYPPEKAGGAAAAAAGPPAGRGGRGGADGSGDEESAGATVILRELSNGRDTSFGNVADFAWQDLKPSGHLLAMTISTEDKTGNAVQLFDTATASLRVLDSATSIYSDLAWHKDSGDLAVLRSKTDDKHDGPTSVAMVWWHLGETKENAHVYDPTADAKFPTGMRLVTYRRPSWSDDGATVFLGYAPWYEKPPSARRGGRGGTDAAKNDDAAKKDDAEDEPADVDVWHWRDIDVMAKQKKGATQDGRRNMLAAWHVADGKFTPLARALTEQVTPIKHRNQAFLTDWKDFAMERTIGRPAADLYLVDLATGDRTKVKEHILEDHLVQASPGGRYLIYLQDDNYWTVNTETRAVANITKNIKSSFVDLEADHTVKQKPPFGVAGWTKNDAAVILYDKCDLWRISPDGARATKLTDGATDQVRHRYVRLDPDEEFIDTDKPLYLSLFGIWSKKSGYARLMPAGGELREGAHVEKLMLVDKSIERLAKAKDADVYAYVAETFEDSPNVFVSGPDLGNPKQATTTNPFQSNYAWSRSQLIEYKSPAGVRLQGSLYYPAGYEAGKKYPMVVYMYEKLSDGLHRYNAPSQRSYYSASAITSHGYFLLEPDIVFRKREPGLSVDECVSAALKKVFELGVVDEKKVGVVGHSWGGFDAAFLATHNTMIAAAVAGAPITNLVSNYGNHHWSSGIAETDHIETGQQRMEVPLWEDLPAYIRNSAVYNAQNMTVPLLIEVGDADGTVFYHQGVELYNIARRAKKNVVLLVYGGEDHGLRKKADQVDYQTRIFEWFGHYLKGEPAASWITNGEGYLDHQRELKKVKTQ
jgi:dipeptidyl aminopeptidase/acylaminoacyl peptidase